MEGPYSCVCHKGVTWVYDAKYDYGVDDKVKKCADMFSKTKIEIMESKDGVFEGMDDDGQ